MGRIIGIDLGTTTSEVAYIKNGKAEIIVNDYSSSVTPSVVGLRKNEIIVGKPAKNQLINEPKNTVAEVKRLMGTNEVVHLGSKKYSPTEISKIILEHLKDTAEKFLHEKVTDAVITVPANFTDIQRKATKQAAEAAGLKVARLINEPTAAALAFGIDNLNVEGKILAYDLGGGTFDVTVLEMIEQSMDVMASRGINKLGGKDFDEVIVKEILKRFKNEHGLNLSDDVMAYSKVKEAAENAKIELSTAQSSNIYLPFIAFKDSQPISFETEILRSEYEKLIAGYVEQSMQTVKEALEGAGLNPADIDIVLPVGGSSRTPLVLNSLRKLFGEKLRGGINPDEAVALGAAVQAGLLSSEISGTDSIAIFDVCNHTLGTSVLNNSQDGLEYSRLILRDTHLPFANTRRYNTVSDFQTEVNIKIYQGENDDITKNLLIGELVVDGIPENYACKEAIDIEFRYNLNGMLEVNVTIVSTGKKVSKTINMLNYDAPIDKNPEKENYNLSDELKTTFVIYNNKRSNLPPDAVRKADDLVLQIKKAIVDNNAELARKLDAELTEILFEY